MSGQKENIPNKHLLSKSHSTLTGLDDEGETSNGTYDFCIVDESEFLVCMVIVQTEVLREKKTKKNKKHMFTCNGTIDPVVRAPVELQSVVDQLPQKRERAKERTKAHCISAKEGVLENLPK